MINILEAANRFNQNIDEILYKFSDKIDSEITSLRGYTEQVKFDMYTTFLLERSMYHLNRSEYPEGLRQLMHCLGESSRLNNQTDMIHCLALFERYKSMASTDVEHQYRLIMMEVLKHYEKKRVYYLILLSFSLINTSKLDVFITYHRSSHFLQTMVVVDCNIIFYAIVD